MKPTVPKRPYRSAQAFRRKLIEEMQADAYRVSATPTDGLEDLEAQLRRERIRLVPDVDVCDDHPRIGLNLAPEIVAANADKWAETPDERESTRYFLERMRGNTPELYSTGLGGDAA
jgi:hypothetical protein